MLRLPPTAALRALEAAARHLSYTRAAEELHITQSAVSHQIRHVEGLWGLKMFARRGRRLALTPEGQALVPIVREFMDRLAEALKELGSQEERGALRVSLLQSFAYKWLVPRLGEFARIHPEIDVWISTSDRYADFRSADVDVAIRLGTGDWPDLHVTPLLHEYAFPVCSPRWPHGICCAIRCCTRRRMGSDRTGRAGCVSPACTCEPCRKDRDSRTPASRCRRPSTGRVLLWRAAPTSRTTWPWAD